MTTLDLSQFTGTESYYPWSPLFRNFVLTDGTQYLADTAGAFWLMDAVASHFGSYKAEQFVCVTLTKRKKDWLLHFDDGNGKTLAKQRIEYSDFPLDEIKLYVCVQDGMRVVMLPSEY